MSIERSPICEKKNRQSWRTGGISLMFAIVGLCFVIFIAGCHGTAGNGAGDGIEAEDDGAAADDGKLSVICTLFPQYDFARYIGKGQADVTLLLSPGQEAHMYDPTPADMVDISDCDVFIYTGDAMEGWAAQIVDSLDDSVYVLDLSQYVTLREEEEDGHDHEEEHHHHGAYDPHYWLDLTNAAAMAQAIGDVLSNLDEGHSGNTQSGPASMWDGCWIWTRRLWIRSITVRERTLSLAGVLPTVILSTVTVWNMRRSITPVLRSQIRG